MSKFTNLTSLLFDKSSITKIVDLPPQMTCIDLSNLKLNAIPDLSSTKYLVSLNISDNCIADLDATKLPLGLEILDIQRNSITKIPDVSKFSSLK